MSASGKPALSSSSFDWSASRLGAPDAWPQALRLAADFLFNTPLPMLLVWGRDMTVLFNSAYADLAGPAYGRLPGGSVPPVLPPPRRIMDENSFGVLWDGQYEALNRLILGLGFDVGDALMKHGMPAERAGRIGNCSIRLR